MKTKTLLSLTPLLLLFFSACNLFGPDTATYDITLLSGETYDINLGQSGDEEGLLFITRPLHGLGSGTWRDTVTFEMHFMYVPDSGYVGTDYVKLAMISYDLENGWDCEFDPDIESYVEFNFTINGATGKRY